MKVRQWSLKGVCGNCDNHKHSVMQAKAWPPPTPSVLSRADYPSKDRWHVHIGGTWATQHMAQHRSISSHAMLCLAEIAHNTHTHKQACKRFKHTKTIMHVHTYTYTGYTHACKHVYSHRIHDPPTHTQIQCVQTQTLSQYFEFFWRP